MKMKLVYFSLLIGLVFLPVFSSGNEEKIDSVHSRKLFWPEFSSLESTSDYHKAFLLDIIKRKRKGIVAGNFIFAGAALLQYAWLEPKAASIPLDSLAEQIAIISPSLLFTGTSVAGAGMPLVRMREIGRAYAKYTGEKDYVDLTLPLNIAGDALTGISVVLNVYSVIYQKELYYKIGKAAEIIGASAFALQNIYALILSKKIVKKAMVKTEKDGEVESGIDMNIYPVVYGKRGGGFALTVRF